MTTYDAIPYPSHSYPQSSPAHLNGVAKLFGLSPVDLKTAKILEIGCASGGNIIPLAARFPEAEFIGIDLSKTQTDMAKSKAETLELSNIKFISNSIVEHNFKREKFDYIITHGVYSWVQSNVQQRILKICGENLSKNGVAFISYNTLPGWNAVKTIRDMMLYHGQNFDDPAQKVLEARNMLKFVADNMKAETGPYKETLEAEISMLQNVSDNYLLHDHLEAVNEPCYFHEFAAKATIQGLSYLGDADLPYMFLGNYNEKVSGTLMQMDDAVRQEQYLDFINNRRIRMSLLVKEGAEINRNITPERLEGLRYILNYQLAKPIDMAQLGKVEELDLIGMRNTNLKANIKGRVTCAAVVEMLRALPNRLNMEETVEATSKVLADVKHETIDQELKGLFFEFLFKGILSITSDDVAPVAEITQQPSVFYPAILQGQSMDMVANLNHEMVKLSNDQRLVLQYVNGKNSIEQICAYVKNHIEKDELTLNADGKPLEPNTDNYEAHVQQYVDGALKVFAHNALLVG